ATHTRDLLSRFRKRPPTQSRNPGMLIESMSIPGLSFETRASTSLRLALGVTVDTPRELRIVSLGGRNDEVHVRPELETILMIITGRENGFGRTRILAHKASHIAKPVRRGKQRERSLMEEQIDARRRRARIRDRAQLLERTEIVDLLQERGGVPLLEL